MWLGRFCSAQLSMSPWRSDHLIASGRGVWRMASEDSAEDFFQRTLALFPVEVHRVSDLNDLRKAGWCPVGGLCEEPQDVPEAFEVSPTRGEPHVSRQEW